MTDEHMANLNFYDISVLNQTWKNNSFFSYETRRRPFFGLCLILSGEIKYKTEKGCAVALAGDVAVLKKNAQYRAVFDSCCTENILVNFQCEAYNNENDLFGDENDKITVLKNRDDLKEKFLNILKYSSMNDRRCKVKGILYDIMDDICSFKTENAAHDLITRVVDEDTEFLMNEYDMAQKCSVSVSTFQRRFKKLRGMTVCEYRNQLRIARAKALLTSGNYSMEEIAEILGFCDGAYFSRCFKKAEGVSPKTYLKQYYEM